MAASVSFTELIASGVRPLNIRAQVSQWLGQQIPLTNHEFWQQWLGTGSFTGKAVRVSDALKLSTVWACVRLIAETMATLPLALFQKQSDGSSVELTRHNLYEILHNSPNLEMTAADFWQVVLASMLLWGNAYIEIKRSGGVIVALNFLMPNAMSDRKLASGRREYKYLDPVSGATRDIAPENMMHIPAFSMDGIHGLSVVAYGCNVFGTAIETDRASAETFANANRATGILSVNKFLTNQQREQYRAHVRKVSEEGGVYVFESGSKYEDIKFNPHDAELLMSREFNIEEICRWFGIDPAMVGHGGKDSNWGTGLEQKALWFLIFALRKWCVRIEQSIRKSLLTPAERASRIYAKFNMEGLLRGDSASRASFYSTVVQNGIYTRDECREKEDLPPMGGNAAVLTIQSNMLPIDKVGEDIGGNDSNSARDAVLAWLGLEKGKPNVE